MIDTLSENKTNKDIITSEYKELLLGCGTRTHKDLYAEGKQEFTNVTRLDINPDCKPDIVHNLNYYPLPFSDNEFDEIHAYDVLEHLGAQGDYEQFFREFSEYWRILKHNGCLYASVPALTSPWLWGDPGHVRAISYETLIFLRQDSYAQCGKTKMTDYRNIYKADFRIRTFNNENDPNTFYFILQAVKGKRTS